MILPKKSTVTEAFCKPYDGGAIPHGYVVTELLQWCYPTKQHLDNLDLKAIHHRVLLKVIPASNDAELIPHE
jgi:hypothetical protein